MRRRWTYPGVLAPVRLVAFPMMIAAVVIGSTPLSMFGAGWWLACLVCEFAYHHTAPQTIRWRDVTPGMLEDAWIAKLKEEKAA